MQGIGWFPLPGMMGVMPGQRHTDHFRCLSDFCSASAVLPQKMLSLFAHLC
jgi:hypothetical protein